MSEAGVRAASLKVVLDRLYMEYDRPASARDPVQIVRRFTDSRDQEIAAFVSASLAFGRVEGILGTLERLMACIGSSPAAFVRRFDPARHGAAIRRLGHRWIRGSDIVALLWILRCMLDEAGSIEAWFVAGDDPAATDVGPALESFSSRARVIDVGAVYGSGASSRGVDYFFPKPSAGSACKRLNLFLRWMVRRDGIDLGVWSRVSASRLVVPLDTHLIRLGRSLGLTRYASPGWRMAAEITASLREMDPDDPVRYDFALCHLGMSACVSCQSPAPGCPLALFCAPQGSRPRGSRRPSDRR
ncbi:MAG: TIGR02757 family protein [Vicinamibacterales bacterium]